jgi:glycine cleavage system regulatory protein
MDTHLVLTVIGRDRPGLVNAISETVTAGGGNWLDTHMASLAGQFAGILLVSVPQAKSDALVEALKKLDTQGLRLIIENAGDNSTLEGQPMTLEVVGHDRPGIVRDVSRALAAERVSIVELETERVAGSFSGEAMFKARARLLLPEGLRAEKVQKSLESIANELMVDLSFESGN